MFTNMFVQNEPVHAGCGKPVGNCSCGPQSRVTNSAWKPEPMPVFNWEEFYDVQAGKAPATTKATYKSAKPSRSSAGWKPEPMPVYNWDEFYSRSK